MAAAWAVAAGLERAAAWAVAAGLEKDLVAAGLEKDLVAWAVAAGLEKDLVAAGLHHGQWRQCVRPPLERAARPMGQRRWEQWLEGAEVVATALH